MVLVPSLLFLAVLNAVHAADPDSFGKPLSMTRDGRYPAAGYALFALLLGVGAAHVRGYYAAGRWRHAGGPALSLALLAVVAVTPSWNAIHAVAAFSLFGVVFAHYAGRLHAAGSPWLYAHLAAPVALTVAVFGWSDLTYGVWQKGLILYFLLAVNLDYLLVTGWLRLPGPEDFERSRRRRKTATYSPRVMWRRYDRPAAKRE